jgi:uncharacterized protein YrrD
LTALIVGTSIRGLPVVTVTTGEDVAEVRDIIYRAEAGRIVGFTLNKRGLLSGRFSEVLLIEHVQAIGRDAVMIGDESQLADRDQVASEVGSPEAGRDVTDNDVLTEAGVSLGHVRDVVIRAGAGGEVVGYQIELSSGGSAFIPSPAQFAISGDALVVPDVTEEFLSHDLAGLGTAVDEFRSRLATP